MGSEEFLHRFGIRVGMCAERPADRFSHEELFFVGPPEAEVEQACFVGFVFVFYLADDGGASQPEVLVVDSLIDFGIKCVAVLLIRAADEVDRDSIDEIPPCAVDDQSAVGWYI